MKTKVWIAITDGGDGSHDACLYPSEEALRELLMLDEDDFQPGDDIPVEIVSRVIDTDDYKVVED